MSALDDAARELHQEGYEEGCNDGYRKALDDVLDLWTDEDDGVPLGASEVRREVQELRRRAR